MQNLDLKKTQITWGSSNNMMIGMLFDSAFDLLICTLISENQGLRNQGLFQTLEKFQVLHTWIFFQFVNSICFSFMV